MGKTSADRLPPTREQALGSFLWQDRGRILAMAARLREAGGALELRIVGGSMDPAVPGGASLRIRVARGDSYPVGRVVAFLVRSRVMVHRVVYRCRFGRARSHLICRGDVMFLPDAPVREADVLGPVVEVEDAGGWRDPGPPARRPWPKRLLAGTLLVVLVVIAEVNVSLAQRLATGAVRLRDWIFR